MKIRSHLLLLVLAAVLPIVAFSTIMTVVFWREQRHAFEQRFLERARAMAIALDRELDGSIKSLQVLADSPHLQAGDLESFYEQLQKTLQLQRTWRNLILADAVTGTQLINLRRPYGAPLPAIDKRNMGEVWKSGRPYVPPLSKGPVSGEWVTRVIVPVKSDGSRQYVLVAVFDNSSWSRFLQSYPITRNATLTLLDQNGIIIARTLNPERWVGQLPAPALYSASRNDPEAAYISKGLEGQWFYSAHSRSRMSGWTVATGVPQSGVEVALRDSTILMSLGAIASATLAIVLTIVFGKRIAHPVADLARSARALASGERVHFEHATDVDEVAKVRAAFYEASERIREQDSILRNSEERLRLAMKTGKLGAWDWDIIENHVVWTESLYEIHGVRPDQFDPTVDGFVSLVAPEDRKMVQETLESAVRGDTSYEVEFRSVRPDGRTIWLFTNAVVVRENGRPVRMLGATMDVTERKRAEQTVRSLLRISERLNSSLDVESLVDILIVEASRMVDAESGVAGLRNSEGMACRKYFQSGQFVPLEYCWKPGHGLPGWLMQHKIPYLTNDAEHDPQIVRELCEQFGVRSALSVPILNTERETIGFFELHNKKHGAGFTENDQRTLMAISETAATAIQNALAYREVQNAEESLREADRRKDEYLAMLGHELRNPLGVISTAVQLLRKSAGETSQLTDLREIVEHQVDHMARLMDDLLDVSRISRGQMRLNMKVCDLADIVRQTTDDYRATLENNGLKLTVSLPQRAVWVSGDPTRLAQSISNLIHNASKFSDAGAFVRVVLSVDRTQNRAVLTVRDTGIGMEPQVVSRLFEPFSRGSHGMDRSRGGLGLGLALVKGLIEAQGGRVSASSEGPGQGSELTIQLPLHDGPVQEPEILSAQVPAPGPRRVLIVEDNTVAARTMRMFLTQTGHSVEVAHSGPDGITAAIRFHPEVVLCDIGLPGCDGYEVARRIRDEESLEGVYLIAISGYGQETDKQRAYDAGFDGYLVKPVNLSELEKMLARPGEPENVGISAFH